MLFRIKGIDAQGRKREISVDAATEAEALRRASTMGVTVTGAENLSNKAPASRDRALASSYPAITTYATLGRIVGFLTILFAVVAAIALGAARDRNLLAAFGVLVAGVVAGVGQLAFAELLELLVKLKANTQYMCERLYNLEMQSKGSQSGGSASQPRD
jgi:hypothetical protein